MVVMLPLDTAPALPVAPACASIGLILVQSGILGKIHFEVGGLAGKGDGKCVGTAIMLLA